MIFAVFASFAFMTLVADVIVRRLRDAGVVTLFGMPGGGSNLDLVDAASRAGLPFVLTATETGAAIAAVAQAEIGGRPGACLTTLGPGVTSVVNGVACASLDRAPLLVFTDCNPSSAAAFEHQRLDHRALLAPVTKWSATLSAENAEAVLAEAIERATSGLPGAVHIDVPSDVGCRAGLSGPPRGPERAALQLTTDDRQLATDDWRLMTDSRRPLLLVGLGARQASDTAAIRAFCHRHGVPAMVTYKAKGVIPDDDPHFAGVFTNAAIERPILDRADLLIGVGLDPVELLPRAWAHRQPVVSINSWRVDEGHVPFVAQQVGDIAAGVDAVAERVSNIAWDLKSLRDEVASQRRLLDTTRRGLTPDRVVRVAAQAAQDLRVTLDAGAHMLPATLLWPVAAPHGMLVSNGLSTMGFALPAAIGAALADRRKPVIALTGDGGLLICAGELLTAARERLRVVTIVFSDASLSLIAVKQQQRNLAPAGVALGDVAWCALAESFGVSAHFASTEAELEAALSKALARPGPSLIEARVDPSSYGDVLRAVRG
jgi:acetolactate synthase I/II/III large subunit